MNDHSGLIAGLTKQYRKNYQPPQQKSRIERDSGNVLLNLCIFSISFSNQNIHSFEVQAVDLEKKITKLQTTLMPANYLLALLYHRADVVQKSKN